MWLIHLVVQQKLTQHWKAVTFQLKMKANGKEPTREYYRPLLGNYIWWKTANRPTKYWWEVDIVLIQIIIPQSEKFSDILGVSKTKITYHAQIITERIIKGLFFFFSVGNINMYSLERGALGFDLGRQALFNVLPLSAFFHIWYLLYSTLEDPDGS